MFPGGTTATRLCLIIKNLKISNKIPRFLTAAVVRSFRTAAGPGGMDSLCDKIEAAYANGVRVFHVSGMIGAGKSSIVKEAARILKARGRNVAFFFEPIPLETLKKYTLNKKKYATVLQKLFLGKRIVVDGEIEELLIDDPSLLVLVERGCNENTVFVRQNVAEGWIAAADGEKMATQSVPQCETEIAEHAHVFVLADVSTCHERMERRAKNNKDRETEVSAYVKGPDTYFENLFDTWSEWHDEMAARVNNPKNNVIDFDNNANTPELANSTDTA